MKKVTDTSKNPKFDWLFGGNPDAIEDQEAEGQKELVESFQLPVKVNYPSSVPAQEPYEAMGIKLIDLSEHDGLFFTVQLPEGWKIEPTDHSMWSNLLDDKGRKRASIFYKAAFYDRDAFINFENRIDFRVDRLGFLQGDYSMTDGDYTSRKTPFVGRVADCDGTVLFETWYRQCDVEYNENNPDKGYTEKYCDESYKVQKELEKECIAYLNENYPDYKNINAYWD